MKDTLSTLAEGYRTALQEYLLGAGESSLLRAYELGRRAVDQELGILDLAVVHREVLAEVLRESGGTDRAVALAEMAATFFSESLAPFEITHRSYRDANRALRVSEERYRDLFENASDIIFTLDLEGNFNSVNRAGEELTGYRAEEDSHLNISQILAPEYWELARKMLDRKLASGGYSTYEAEIFAKDGRRLTIEVSTRIIHHDGRPTGIQGIARDVTERRRAEQKIQALLEAAPEAMLVVNEEGNMVLANAEVETMFGYRRDELLGSPVEMLVPLSYRARHPSHRADFLAAPRRRLMGPGLNLYGMRKDGSQFPVEVSLAPLETEDGLLITSAIRDITDRKRSEQALRGLNDALEQEASRIAHALHDEAGQLLASVHIAIGNVAEKVPAAARRELLGVKVLLDEIEEQLRRFSHEIRPTILDDLGLAPAIVFLGRRFQGRTGITVFVECAIDQRQPPQTETAIYRVVQEALTNVSRHAHASQVHISIEQKVSTIRGRIRDDGSGFNPATLQSATGRAGLGFRGMQARMDAVGGTLSIRSFPGEGTTIEFTLPSEDAHVSPHTVG